MRKECAMPHPNLETARLLLRPVTPEDEQPEYADKKLVGLGFVIGKPYQNKGYGTEMLKTITAYLKERFDYCVADHFVENAPSRRVIEKAGYRYLEDYSMTFRHLNNERKYLKSYIY